MVLIDNLRIEIFTCWSNWIIRIWCQDFCSPIAAARVTFPAHL
jgi:hypothetical protein